MPTEPFTRWDTDYCYKFADEGACPKEEKDCQPHITVAAANAKADGKAKPKADPKPKPKVKTAAAAFPRSTARSSV